MHDSTISKFILLLSYENWDNVFQEKEVNVLYNNFFNTYLRIHYASFPISKKNVYNSKPLLTTGIRISCANRRKLYITYRKSNNPLHIDHYKSYCHILSEVIMAENEL